MKGWVWLALLTTGCAAVASAPAESSASAPLPPDPLPAPRQRAFHFQVDRDSVLWDDTVKAAAAWAAATGIEVTVSPEGDIPVLLVAALDPDCAPLPQSRGCSRVTGQEGDWSEILESVHWSVRYGVILHEMGHQLRGPAGGHVENNPNAVMAPTRLLSSIDLTPEDVAYVCATTVCAPGPADPL
jgi:hypothetical protein